MIIQRDAMKISITLRIVSCLLILISMLHLVPKSVTKFLHRNITNNHNDTRTMNAYGITGTLKAANKTKQIMRNEETLQKTALSMDELSQIKRRYYTSPIVVEQYKLIFFWNEKCGCSFWKSILRYISGLESDVKNIHDPKENGLKYLCYYSNKNISSMILNSTWLKVAFVREPRERILSCYGDKVINNNYFKHVCGETFKSFKVFLQVIKKCNDVHWESQVRAPKWLYQKMMIGKMSNISDFTVALLKRIGAWDIKIQEKLNKYRYDHQITNASTKLLHYYNDSRFQDTIFEIYKKDYEMFGFEKDYFK